MAKKVVVDGTTLQRISNRLSDIKDTFDDSSYEDAENMASDIGPGSIDGAASDYIGESKAMFDRMSKNIKDLSEGLDQVLDSFKEADDELGKSLEGEEEG
ncbi:hypothetical protein O4J56_14615 [Nocardiopsis sp. RSe5-2]|uniref:Excreted virulence factor EspC (Type VII ESX diderm) n=1 Tax=Nocardiopsis endophytica TaxID=3018445 RepID=A0ABT4U4I8_9ACTN|nr:hypothetical protein [Nocardiopsis endophytica]MDA2811873.1 hypothetical protein [Nocardiopsis endophytica]